MKSHFAGDGSISPSDDVWLMDNGEVLAICACDANEALSTRCGGRGVTIFFDVAKQLRAQQISPGRQP